MKDDINSDENGRQPQLFWKMEDDLKKNKKIIQPETFQIKTMVVAPLRVT